MQSLARALIVAMTVSAGILAAAPPVSAAPPLIAQAGDASHLTASQSTDISASRRHHRYDRYGHYYRYRQPLPYDGYRPYPPPRFCYPPYYGYAYGFGPLPPFFSWGCNW